MRMGFVFPGQGSQVVGMGKDFFENFKESKLAFEEAEDAIHVKLRKLCFEGPMDELTLTENLQPALFTVEAGILAAIRAHTDVLPVVTAGHSLGEYAALHACGSLDVTVGARLTRLRGGAMQRAVPQGQGAMAAILGLTSEQVEALCKKVRELLPNEVAEPANFNAPGQIVIAGTSLGIARASELLKEDSIFKGGKSIPLQVSAPFHCSLMKPAQEQMAKELASIQFKKPTCLIIPNVTAEPSESEYSINGTLTDQITQPVRWEQSMRNLSQLQVTQIVEIGPGKVLAGLQKRIDPSITAKNISSVAQLTEVFK